MKHNFSSSLNLLILPTPGPGSAVSAGLPAARERTGGWSPGVGCGGWSESPGLERANPGTSLSALPWNMR